MSKLYHTKQEKILKYAVNNDFFMLINHGAKRTGKTILNNDLFLLELKRVKKLASIEGVDEPQYILAGADLGALQRNVLIELSNKYGLRFQFDKYNRFNLFGVKVCCFGHSKANDLGRIRGMTAYGAYINEASMAKEDVFSEIKNRCSGSGARLLIDTNPDNPEHWLKKNYIDKADGKVIQEYSFQLDDNTFLSERYRKNIKESTPTGVFYDRDIDGKWVSAEGVVYRDFDLHKHYVNELPEMVRYFCGVDWGYSHYGVIVVIGVDDRNNFYLIEEYAKQYEEIDYWVDIAKNIKTRYGNIPFYCDTARPEYLVKFAKNKLKAMKGSKRVMSGIECVAKKLKTNKLFIYEPAVNRFKKEIYSYVWGTNGEPNKVDDDVMDALRYALYSDEIARNGK